MAMKIIELVSRETIKPSSPTPSNHQNFKLSLLDQLAPEIYIPIILFYRPCAESHTSGDDRLKKSLAEILTHMYSLAGRVKDMFSIDCSDQGAEFINAKVHHDVNMSTLIQNPKLHLLQQLLPCEYPLTLTTTEQVLLAVQVNRFACGGTALGMCVGHVIADRASMGTFIKNWAAISRGSGGEENNVTTSNLFVDRITLFPPRDVSFMKKNNFYQQVGQKKRTTKAYRFVVSGSNISALKGKIAAETAAKESPQLILHPPTRVEVVSAILWLALTSDIRDRKKISYLTSMVNLRPRMKPQMPPESLGNICQALPNMWNETTAGVVATDVLLLKQIQDCLRKLDGETIMKHHQSGDCFTQFKRGTEESGNYQDVMGFLNISSWCRFPVYEADFGFGWGKTIWACSPAINVNAAILMDTPDGVGIEAWVRLQEEDMNNFLQNPGFFSYVSSSQSI